MALGGHFVAGLAVGGLLGASAAAALAEGETPTGLIRSVLYAINELSVDTEINAERIVELSDRIDELEVTLTKLQAKPD